jgi:cystathionine gamma-lyase
MATTRGPSRTTATLSCANTSRSLFRLVSRVTTHPQHALAKKQMKGFGGMLTFELRAGLEASRRFLKAVRIFACAESLGGVESLIEHPAIMTHASVPKQTREHLGISDGFIRASVGIEDPQDLVDDLSHALDVA